MCDTITVRGHSTISGSKAPAKDFLLSGVNRLPLTVVVCSTPLMSPARFDRRARWQLAVFSWCRGWVMQCTLYGMCALTATVV